MGFLFKQKYTQSLPADAKFKTKKRKPTKRELKADSSRLEIVETIARWRDRSGDWCEGVLVGSNRVRMRSATWSARYRDGDGLIQTVPTGCRDKSAAETMLKDLEKTAERIHVGVVTTSELSTASIYFPVSSHISQSTSIFCGIRAVKVSANGFRLVTYPMRSEAFNES